MSFGNNGAGPQGAPIFGNQGPAAAPVAAGPVLGQAGAPANGATPFYSASFESIYAAMCRGEIPANVAVAASPLAGVGTPTAVSLLQAISQGQPQNGTNGLGVKSGPCQGEGTQALGLNGTSFGGTQVDDAKQMANVPPLSNPIQYAGS